MGLALIGSLRAGTSHTLKRQLVLFHCRAIGESTDNGECPFSTGKCNKKLAFVHWKGLEVDTHTRKARNDFTYQK